MKRPMIGLLLIIIFSGLICSVSFADNQMLGGSLKDVKVVKVDLSTGYFEHSLPFDESFYIEGDVSPDTINMVVLNYSMLEGKRGFFDFSKRTLTDTEPKWKRIKGTKPKKFKIRVDPLYPDKKYKFVFTLYKSKLPERIINELKEEIIKELKQNDESLTKFLFTDEMNLEKSNQLMIFSKSKDSLDQKYDDFVNELADSLQEKIAAMNGKKLSPEELESFKQKVNNNLQLLKEQHFLILSGMEKHQRNKLALLKKIKSQYEKIKEKGVDEKLSEIIPNPNLLLDRSKLDWLKVIEESTNKITYSQMGGYFATQLKGDEFFIRFLEGKENISGRVLVKNKSLDLKELNQLIAFQTLISGATFKDKNDKSILSVDQREAVSAQTAELRSYAEECKEFNRFETKYTKFIADLSELFSDIVFTESAEIYASSDPYVITTDKSNYVGLDIGFAYIGAIEEALMYAGANIYLVPVNKNVPLSNYKGADYGFSKRTSILLGLTLTDFEKENHYKPLFTGKGSLLLGLGYRLSEIVKLNAGYLFFKKVDENSIESNSEFQREIFAAVSFDADIGSLFNDFKSWITSPDK